MSEIECIAQKLQLPSHSKSGLLCTMLNYPIDAQSHHTYYYTMIGSISVILQKQFILPYPAIRFIIIIA